MVSKSTFILFLVMLSAWQVMGQVCSVNYWEPLKMLVPLYIYPGTAWSNLAHYKTIEGVEMIAIIDPLSGPSSDPATISAYNAGIATLTGAGIKVVGYMPTWWNSPLQNDTRTIPEMQGNISIYDSYTGLSGIFFDQAPHSTESANISYFTSLYNFVKNKTYNQYVILNPGYPAANGAYMNFENAGANMTVMNSWPTDFPNITCSDPVVHGGYKYKSAGIVNRKSLTADQFQAVLVNMRNAGLGYVYLTDIGDYNTLPGYIFTEVSSVAQLNYMSYSAPSTVCTDNIGEGATATVTCPQSYQKIVSIQFASYGTPTGVCGGYTHSSCDASTSVSVAQSCLYQHSCSIVSSNGVFGDPCSGTVKHFNLQVQCN